MATSQQVKEAADAVALAKADEATAQEALDAKLAEAVALIPDETAALTDAQSAYNSAIQTAFVTVGYNAALATYTDAVTVRTNAVNALISTTADYDGF